MEEFPDIAPHDSAPHENRCRTPDGGTACCHIILHTPPPRRTLDGAISRGPARSLPTGTSHLAAGTACCHIILHTPPLAAGAYETTEVRWDCELHGQRLLNIASAAANNDAHTWCYRRPDRHPEYARRESNLQPADQATPKSEPATCWSRARAQPAGREVDALSRRAAAGAPRGLIRASARRIHASWRRVASGRAMDRASRRRRLPWRRLRYATSTLSAGGERT